MVDIIVDGRRIQAEAGRPLLQVCLDNGIYIPHLCFFENSADASCRLCFVQIAGQPAPVTACTVPVSAGLSVQTDTAPVRRLQRSALRLLLSVHAIDCKNCHANRNCALQAIARFLKIGLTPKPLEPIALETLVVDTSHPCLDHFARRCVLCGRCIRACHDQGQAQLTLAGRGITTRVGHFPGDAHAAVDCTGCARCVAACPVGALQLRPAP